ncbi:hypothetical protein ABTL46_20785, partial [Acinetobacter baumannii]
LVPRVLELTYTAWDLTPLAWAVWEEAEGELREAMAAWRRAAPTPPEEPPPWVEGPYPFPPFPFDPERRFWLRAELDALFFLLYLGTPAEWTREASPELKAFFPTPQDAIAYILDQFP